MLHDLALDGLHVLGQLEALQLLHRPLIKLSSVAKCLLEVLLGLDGHHGDVGGGPSDAGGLPVPDDLLLAAAVQVSLLEDVLPLAGKPPQILCYLVTGG